MASENENPKPLDLNALYLGGLDEAKRVEWEAAAKQGTQAKQAESTAAIKRQAASEESVRTAQAKRTAPPEPAVRSTPTPRSTPPAGVIAPLPAEEVQMPPSFSGYGMTPAEQPSPPWAPTAPMTPAPESMFRPPRDPEMARRIRDASIIRDRFPFPAGMSDEEQNEVLRLGLKEQAFQKRQRELDAWALSGLRRAGSALVHGPERSLRATPRKPTPPGSLGAWWEQRQALMPEQNEPSE
jgi:hypothetical protein